MGDKADKIIGVVVAVASSALGAVAVGSDRPALWITVTLAALGTLGGLVKVGIFGGEK